MYTRASPCITCTGQWSEQVSFEAACLGASKPLRSFLRSFLMVLRCSMPCQAAITRANAVRPTCLGEDALCVTRVT